MAVLATAGVLALGACSSGNDPGVADSSATGAAPTTTAPREAIPAPIGAASECAPGSGKTMTANMLTIATDTPAYEPWFVGNDPANGQGFEGAVARRVAHRLGYTPEQITFVSVPFNEALTPGDKPFDFDINQVTILDQRREAVDFSSPYYSVAQSVVALKDNPAADAQTLADLTSFRLGAQVDSTSLKAIVETIGPTAPVKSYPTNDAVKHALVTGEVDAMVVDLPTGFQIVESQVEGATLVGQFPRPNSVTESFGLVLEKNSPLTPCVSAAVESLYADGVLDALVGKWLTDTGGARLLD